MQEKSEPVGISAEHVRAARGLLKWTQEELARLSGVAAPTINLWENGKSRPTELTRQQVRLAFEKAGVEFTNGDNPGVKWRRAQRLV